METFGYTSNSIIDRKDKGKRGERLFGRKKFESEEREESRKKLTENRR